jgi:hypothetical protein
MPVFRVKVRGYFKDSQNGEVKNAMLDFLVDADSCEQAFVAGPEIAETVAHFGPKWVSFETAEASPIDFPYMLSDTTSSALRRCPE